MIYKKQFELDDEISIALNTKKIIHIECTGAQWLDYTYQIRIYSKNREFQWWYKNKELALKEFESLLEAWANNKDKKNKEYTLQ